MQSINAGQRSLAIGFGQARAKAVDVEGMEVGVRHLGAQLAQLVRRKTTLVQEVQAFIKERGHARLMWSDMKPAEAVRKHQNRIAYMRRKHPCIEHQQGEVSHGE
jgi:hypothetical protein